MRAFGLCTLCLTNEQRFFKEQFTNFETFSYRFEKDHLAGKVADVLAHPRQYVELGLDTAEQFRKNRRSEDFAQFMLDTASHIRLGSGTPAGLQDFRMAADKADNAAVLRGSPWSP